MLRVVAQNERRRISCIVLHLNDFLLSQTRNVTRTSRNAVVETRFIRMARIEKHDASIGQCQERWVVMVIGLKIRANQHFLRCVALVVELQGTHCSVVVDIAHIGSIRLSFFHTHGSRVCKPAPRSLLRQFSSTITRLLCHRLATNQHQQHTSHQFRFHHRFHIDSFFILFLRFSSKNFRVDSAPNSRCRPHPRCLFCHFHSRRQRSR